MCLDASGCVVVGFNDSWYDPFDYYGEAWWNFQSPQFDEVTEVRVYVQGAQCDNLPVWSESTKCETPSSYASGRALSAISIWWSSSS